MATYVVTNLNDSGPGSLRNALWAANRFPGADTITFADHLKGKTINLTSGTLNIGHDVTIDGDLNDDGNADITIKANQKFRVFNVDDGNGVADKHIVLDGLTITGGFTNNAGSFGAGVRNLENLKIKNSAIIGNTTAAADSGGGGIYNGGGDLSIYRSAIGFNSTRGDNSYGGGIYSRGGKVTLFGSTVDFNSTSGKESAGGGIYSEDTDLTIRNSTLSSNSTVGESSSGGGIAHWRKSKITDLILENSTVSHNFTYGRFSHGGGISQGGNSLIMTNSTVTGNRTYGESASGGGLNLLLGKSEVKNSIIAGNEAKLFGGDEMRLVLNLFNVSHSLLGESSNTTQEAFLRYGYWGDFRDVISEIPSVILATRDGNRPTALRDILQPLGSNGGLGRTHALAPNSPAINAGDMNDIPNDWADLDGDGNPAEGILFDQRGNGFKRVSWGQVDMGAVEFQYEPDIELRSHLGEVDAPTPEQALPISPDVIIGYTHSLTNTGNVVLDNVSLWDDSTTADNPNDDRSWSVNKGKVTENGITLVGGDDGDLLFEPGEIWEFITVHVTRSGLVKNTVNARATGSTTSEVATAQDWTYYSGFAPISGTDPNFPIFSTSNMKSLSFGMNSFSKPLQPSSLTKTSSPGFSKFSNLARGTDQTGSGDNSRTPVDSLTGLSSPLSIEGALTAGITNTANGPSGINDVNNIDDGRLVTSVSANGQLTQPEITNGNELMLAPSAGGFNVLAGASNPLDTAFSNQPTAGIPGDGSLPNNSQGLPQIISGGFANTGFNAFSMF